jgi:predicted transglutaminase-like cysteine proteinase
MFTRTTSRIWTFAAATALLATVFAARAGGDEPFGLPTVAAPHGRLSITWRGLRQQMQAESYVIARCRALPDACTSVTALKFIAIAEQGRTHEGLARIGRINREVNLAIRALSTAAGAPPTKWTSPLETLAAGVGDCKQYAVLKYAALRDLGYPTDDLQLIILAIRSARRSHAVVAARHAGRWHILDNNTLHLLDSRSVDDYRPLFALDHRGVRQFVVPSRPEVAALPCDLAVG